MLSVRDLRVGYGTATIIEDVSLDVAPGESVALMGRNGMGKTTLIRAITGLRPPTISAGSVEFDGRPLVGLAAHRITRAGVSLVPQGRQVFGSLTVHENLAIVPRPRDADDVWTTERVYDFFPRLRERSKAAARTLSGGEQQMLAIGRALMSAPRLLIMDEPSEGLAPAVLRVIEDRLQTLRASGLSVLVAEQNVDFALALSDRVVILGEHGRIVWEGLPASLVADASPIHHHLGL